MPYHNLTFEREKEIPVYYREIFIGKRRADFLVDGVIMLELKAIGELEDGNVSQALNYLEEYSMEIGLLINFGAKSLEFKRVHNNKLLKA